MDRVIKVSERAGSSIEPVGVAMFGMDSRAKALNRRARDELEKGLGGVFPVLETEVRHSKKAQIDAKEVGLTAKEHAHLAETTNNELSLGGHSLLQRDR